MLNGGFIRSAITEADAEDPQPATAKDPNGLRVTFASVTGPLVEAVCPQGVVSAVVSEDVHRLADRPVRGVPEPDNRDLAAGPGHRSHPASTASCSAPGRVPASD
jgi:hypothetical protein